ncbi:MAG: arginase family protein, partial [Candidatus Puniceispirillaceae bacterium]
LIGEDEACRHGLYTHPALDCSAPIAEVLHNVQKQVFACIGRGHIPVTLGGEHSLTYGAVKGLQDGLEQPFGIVQIDAHADLRTAYQGEPHSHASVMQLCCSADIPLFQLGVRALCREEVEARRQFNVGYCDADRLVRQQLSSVTLPDDFPELVYVSFDLDGLDPAVLPATGTPVPGGLGFYQALDLVSSACSGRKIVGMDIVELAPSPVHPASNFTAALVTYHLIALALSQR